VDLRRSFEGLLRRTGYNVYLQRRTNAYSGGDPIYSNRLEKHTVRSVVPSMGMSTVEQQDMEGITHDSDRVFYFKHDVNPTAGDRIYEQVPTQPHQQVTWIIDAAEPKRFRNGRIEFWVVGASSETGK